MLCEIPGVPILRAQEAEVVCLSGCVRGTGKGPLLTLELLKLLIVPMSLGWGSGIGRGGTALERDAPFEELDKGELRGGISESDISRVAAVAGAIQLQRPYREDKREWRSTAHQRSSHISARSDDMDC